MDLKYKRIRERIRRGEVAPVYLLLGSDMERKRTLIEDLKTVFFSKKGGTEFDFNTLFPEDYDTLEVKALLENYPMNAKRRLVVLKQLDQILDREKEGLLSLIRTIPDFSCLVISASRVSKTHPLYKAVEARGVVVDFHPLNENSAKDVLFEVLRDAGKEIDAQAMDLFFQIVSSTELDVIKAEAERMILFKGEEVFITQEDVKKVLFGYEGEGVFELLDAISERNLSRSLRIFSRLTNQEEGIAKLLFMLVARFRLLLLVKSGLSQGLPQTQLKKRLRVLSEKQFQSLLRYSSLFTDGELMGLFWDFLDMDFCLKTKRSEVHWQQFERLILKVCIR